MAAQLALRIISGDPAGSIPVVTHSTNPYMFDYRQLKRFGLKASNLPTGSVFIGQPAPFMTRWAKTIIFISAAALLTALFMLGGILRLLKKRHALLQAKTETDNRFKEKTVQLQLVHQKLKKQALIDPLTGLANRRSILARCAEEMKRTQRYGHAFTIAMLDLDHFKRINTSFGYIVGDKILKDIAHAIKRGIRETDMVGRFSGEAFLILLPDTDLAAAQRSAQRLLTAVAALHWEKKQVQTTVSIGLAEYSGQGLPELTAMAEDRQLQAKALGGNQVVSL
jgi:diguanylate cyclase (GGDEF)-like protein